MNDNQDQLLIVSQECLVKWGASSLWGAYPHMWAVLATTDRQKRCSLAKIVVDRGVPLDIADPAGLMPLDIAVQDGDVELIRILIRGGARISPGYGVQKLFSRALVHFNQEDMETLWLRFSPQERDNIWMKVYSMAATAYLSTRPLVSQKLMDLLRKDWPRHHCVKGAIPELVSRWGIVMQTTKSTTVHSLTELEAMVSWSFQGSLPSDTCQHIKDTIMKKTGAPMMSSLSQLFGQWQAQFEAETLTKSSFSSLPMGKPVRL